MNKILDALRVMKLIICLLIISLQASAVAFSQNISLSEKNASIESVIKKIERQSGYSFFYKIDLLRNNPSKVNLSLKNVTIDQALQQTLNNQPLTFVIVNKTVIIKPKLAVGVKSDSPEARKPIKGKVTDGKDPLTGVSVRVDGTNTATMTDDNGNFVLNLVPGTYRIVFSSVGFESKRIEKVVTNDNDDEINIVLNATVAQLQEAIVVGYTVKKPSEITGALQTFTAKELEGVTSNNLISMLKGKITGMYITEPSGDPNSKPSFVVRGQGTLPIEANPRVTNNLNPLIVVDGIIYADAMYPNDIVSNTDIESITLLKDASSTAIYGSRASQGVLVITTKQGKPGMAQLDINSTFGLSKRYMGKIKFMNSHELYDYQKKMLINSFGINDEGLTQPAYLAKYLPPESELSNYTDWDDLFYRDALTKTVDVGLSGGNDQTRYYFGANRYDEQGALKLNDLQRTSFRLRLDHNITKKLSFGANISTIFDEGNTSPSSGGRNTLLPWYTPYNADGTLKETLGADSYGYPVQNPIYDLQYNSNINKTQQLNSIFSARYKLTDWITLSSNNSYSTSFSNSENYLDRLSLAGRYNKGELSQRKTSSNSFMTSNLITANKQLGVHNVGGLAGFEYNRSNSEYNYLSVKNLPTGIKVPSAAAEPLIGSNGKSFDGERFSRGSYSLFTEGNYNYKERYFANASYRMDYSTNFGIENRAGHFYSVGAAWLISNEKFLQNNKYLTSLKLRASYGTSGKVAGEDFLTESFYNFGYQYGGDPAAVINQLGNKSITWEKAFIRNFGVDLELFKRINITADIYQKRNTNLIQRVGTSAVLGVPSQFQNIGEILNKGVELTFTSKNLVGAFSWTTGFNLTYNTNKVVKLFDGKILYGNAGSIKEGDDINSVHVIKWLGVDAQTGLPQFERVNFDASTNTYTKVIVNKYDDVFAGLQPGDEIMNQFQNVGNSTPKYYGGLQNTFGYKGLELSILLNFATDYRVFNNGRGSYFSTEGNNILQYNQIKPAKGQVIWEKPGDIATESMPFRNRMDGVENPSSRTWEDASHIRVRNVRLSYSLPTKLISRAKLTRANVFISGDNLFIFTKKGFYGVDPEGGTMGLSDNYGIGAGYGASRKYLLGLQLSF
ncbi:TonB dependent receptor [compost metagenome]